MSETKAWSPVAVSVCEACALIWSVTMLGGCAYVVFWLDRSGWWFVLAAFLSGTWNCKYLRSPQQIAEEK